MAERALPPAAGGRRWPARRSVAPSVAVALVAAVVGYPLAELVATVAGEGRSAVTAAFAGSGVARATANTLWTSAVVTVLAVGLGAAAAAATERLATPGRRALRIALLLSFVVPSFVAAQSWARAYGPGGLTDDLLGVALPGVFGAVGVVAVLTVHAVPVAYLVVAAGLAARAEPDAVRAARASGATAWQAVRTVSLPLLRPSLVAAAVLVFVTSVNAFGVPAVLGLPGGFTTLTTRIYRDLALSADPAAFSRVVVLSVTLVVTALLVVGAADVAGFLRRPLARTGAPPGGGPPVAGRRRAWAVGVGLWTFVVLAEVVPLAALVLTALSRAVGLPPAPAHWTLANFGEALTTHTAGALSNSLVLATTAATAVVVLGGLLAVLGRRRAGRPLGTAAVLTFATPGSALAVAVLLAYGSWLRDTLLLILVAYVAKLWAVGHRTIAGSAEALPADLVHAARASGAGPPTLVRTVVAPLLLPAIAAAWLVVFTIGLHELTMSILLYGPGTATLAVTVLNAQQLGDATVTAALAVLLTVLVVVATAPLLAVHRLVRVRR